LHYAISHFPNRHTHTLLSFECCDAPHHLHSFPTRRSSDLLLDRVVGQHLRRQGFQRRIGQGAEPIFMHRANGVTLQPQIGDSRQDRKSTRLNSSHVAISYAVFCLKKKKDNTCLSSSHVSYE